MSPTPSSASMSLRPLRGIGAPAQALRHPLVVWGAVAAAVALLPLVLQGDFALSIAAQIGIAIVFALSYDLLLGQGGMLSFGHAVYAGLGGYFTIHALAAINAGHWAFPVSLLPLVGGLAGVAIALLLGWVSTRRAGTTFAMISLGIGELVTACVLMIPAFFGGEAGVSANRVTGVGWFGIDFATPREMLYLIGAWAVVCAAAIRFVTVTPFGRLANAVRDNPERVAFIGYSTHRVRYQLLVMAGGFAGIAGGLAALNNEIVTIETVAAHASGLVLLIVFIGGIGRFAGPVVGAVVVTLLQTVVSGWTHAWLFYFGLLFLAMVLWSPGGLAGLAATTAALARARGGWREALPTLAGVGAALALLLAGTVLAVESAYRRFGDDAGEAITVGVVVVDPATPWPWVAAAVLIVAGGALMRRATHAAPSRSAR